jgi:hypothetical protein
MRRPSVIVLLLGVLAAVILLRRQRASRGEHVDLYYEDGSMVSLENGAGDAERLLALARNALRS